MRRAGIWAGLVWLTLSVAGFAQDAETWGQPTTPRYGQPSPYPDQPIIPNDPTIQRRSPSQDPGEFSPPSSERMPPGLTPGRVGAGDPRGQPFRPPAPDPRQPLPCPFSPPPAPHEEANLDRVLLYWEQSSKSIKTFRCEFERLDYDPLDPTRRPNEPKVDRGEIRYSAPDKALFRVKGGTGEQWVCDGKVVYEMDPVRRQMIVHKLPPELQGKAIAEGPVPFLFGAKAAQLKQRYYLRIITPEARRQQEVWLEAWPRFPADAQNFKYAELILAIGNKTLMPTAVQIHHPNGKNRMVYTLSSIEVNKTDFGGLFGNPFQPKAPRGWQTVVEGPPEGPPNVPPPTARQGPPAVGIRPGVGRN